MDVTDKKYARRCPCKTVVCPSVVKGMISDSICQTYYMISDRPADRVSEKEIEYTSHCLIHSILFLSKECITTMLQILKPVLVCEKPQTIHLVFPLADFMLVRRNYAIFRTLAVIGLKCLKWTNETIPEEDYTDLTQIVIAAALSEALKHEYATLNILKSLWTLLNEHIHVISTHLKIRIFQACFNLIVSPYAGVKLYSVKILLVVIPSYERKIRIHFIRELLEDQSIRNTNFFLLSAIIDSFSITQEIEIEDWDRQTLHYAFKGLCINTCESSSGDVYKAVLQRLPFSRFKVLFPECFINFTNMTIPYRKSMRNVMKYIVPASIFEYREKFYYYIRKLNIDPILGVFVLFLCVKNGYVVVTDLKDDLEYYIHESSQEVASIGFSALSIFLRKTFLINTWQIGLIKSYLQNIDDQRDKDLLLKDINYIISHMCVCSVTVQLLEKNANNEQILFEYRNFIFWLHKLTVRLMSSDTPEFISLGCAIFDKVYTILTGSSCDLKLEYRIEEFLSYGTCENPLYQMMKSSKYWPMCTRNMLLKILPKCFCKDNYFEPISKLINKWLLEYLTESEVVDILKYSVSLCSVADHNSCNRGYDCLCIYIQYKQKVLNQKPQKELKFIFRQCIYQFKNLLSGPITETILQNPIYPYLKAITFSINLDYANTEDVETYYRFSYDVACYIICQLNDLEEYDEDTAKYSDCPRKVAEELLIICLELISMLILQNKLEVTFLSDIAELVRLVISTSNMKRVITAAAVKLRSLCISLSTHDYKENYMQVIIDLLESVLNSITYTPEIQNSRIRRNPESRLLIHAIVTSEQHPNKPLLLRSLDYLLKVPYDNSLSSSSIASAFHCLEILVSDNSIRYTTMPYISCIMVQCINHFARPDWKIKNSTLQVLQSLLNRLFGQYDNMYRRISMQDVFVFFPNLIPIFYMKLAGLYPTFLDSETIIAILVLFSETSCKTKFLVDPDLSRVTQAFTKLFVHLINTSQSSVGYFAALAYSAFTSFSDIPTQVCDIVHFIKSQFRYMSKNIFHNYWHLLQNLYVKYCGFISNSSFPKMGLVLIQTAFYNLLLVLKPYSYIYETSLFSMIGIRSESVENVANKILFYLESGVPVFEKQLCFRNYLLHVLNNCNSNDFVQYLKCYLNYNLPITLQYYCLCSVIIRLRNDTGTLLLTINDILNVLILSFMKSKFCQYLEVSYSEIILLLFEHADNFIVTTDLLLYFRNSNIRTYCNSIYYASVCAAILLRIERHTDSDFALINQILTTYKKVAVIDDEVGIHAASTLKYLYNCVSKEQRGDVLKLAFNYLFNRDTSFEICKFVYYIFPGYYKNASICNILEIMLTPRNLIHSLGDHYKVAQFLIDISVFTSNLCNADIASDTFYKAEVDSIILYKNFIQSVIIRKLYDTVSSLRSKCCSVVLVVKNS